MKRGLVADARAAAAATLTKAILGLVVSALIAFRVPDHAAAGYFQLLILQSAFITFVSGAAFVRGAKASGDGDASMSLVREQLRFVPFTFAVAYPALLFFLPKDYLGQSNSVALIGLLLLLSGSLSAVVGLMQGLLVSYVGRTRIFAPVMIANLAGCAALGLLWGRLNLLTISAVLCGVQLWVLVELLLRHPQARGWLTQWKIFKSSGGDRIGYDSLYIGIVNTIFLVAMFAVREYWKTHQTAALASNVFFLLRISDTALQVPFLVLGSNATLIAAGESRLLSSLNTRRLAVIGFAVVFAISMSALVLLGQEIALQGIVWLILAQGFVDLMRLPASTANISLLMRPTASSYALTTVCGVAIASGILFFTGLLVRPEGVYLFLALLSAIQLVGAYVAARAAHLRAPALP